MNRATVWFASGIDGRLPILDLSGPELFVEAAHYGGYDLNNCATEVVQSLPDPMATAIYKVEFDIEMLKDHNGDIDDYKCMDPEFELIDYYNWLKPNE